MTTFSPVRPAKGMNVMRFSMKLASVKNAVIFFVISSKRPLDHETVSILFTATMMCCMPILRAIRMCSLVCPFRPASKLFVLASITNTGKSAWEDPEIIFGIKSLWPGASRMVKRDLSVSK